MSRVVSSNSLAGLSEHVCGGFCWSCPLLQSRLTAQKQIEVHWFLWGEREEMGQELKKISVKYHKTFFTVKIRFILKLIIILQNESI